MVTGAVLSGALLAGCSGGEDPADGPRHLPLVGPTWTVEAYDTGEGKTRPPDGVSATLQLSPDGTVTLQPGCNTGSGRFDAGAGTIEIRELTTTTLSCGGPEDELEDAVLSVLSQDILKWAITGDLLTLELPESVGQEWIDLRGELPEDAGG